MKTPLSLPLVPWLGTAQLGRWDVAVFKLPEEPDVRYIKRMVGMPGGGVRILRGDIWVGPLDASTPFRRALRPLRHQDAMQMLVTTTASAHERWRDDRRWARWVSRPEGPAGWSETRPGTFRASPKQVYGWSELRYRHVVPDPSSGPPWPPAGAPAPTPLDSRDRLLRVQNRRHRDGVAQVLGRTCLVTRLIGTYHYNQTP